MKNILLENNFNATTVPNEYKHNESTRTAVLGKNSCTIVKFTPYTERFIHSQTFNSEIELKKYFENIFN